MAKKRDIAEDEEYLEELEQEEKEFDNYHTRATDEGDNNYLWILTAAGLLGTYLALTSLQPEGPRDKPTFLESPIEAIETTPGAFEQIYTLEINVDIETEIFSHYFSDEEIAQYQTLSEEIRQYGRLEDPKTIENKAFSDAQRISDMTGSFGNIEGWKAGYLDSAMFYDVKIPWVTAGDDKVCDDCKEKEANGPYYPDEYPEPDHYGCRCGPEEPIVIIAAA